MEELKSLHLSLVMSIETDLDTKVGGAFFELMVALKAESDGIKCSELLMGRKDFSTHDSPTAKRFHSMLKLTSNVQIPVWHSCEKETIPDEVYAYCIGITAETFKQLVGLKPEYLEHRQLDSTDTLLSLVSVMSEIVYFLLPHINFDFATIATEGTGYVKSSNKIRHRGLYVEKTVCDLLEIAASEVPPNEFQFVSAFL